MNQSLSELASGVVTGAERKAERREVAKELRRAAVRLELEHARLEVLTRDLSVSVRVCHVIDGGQHAKSPPPKQPNRKATPHEVPMCPMLSPRQRT